jgi:hypothetical protein
MKHQSSVVQFDQVRSDELDEIKRRFGRDERDQPVGRCASGAQPLSATPHYN